MRPQPVLFVKFTYIGWISDRVKSVLGFLLVSIPVYQIRLETEGYLRI